MRKKLLITTALVALISASNAYAAKHVIEEGENKELSEGYSGFSDATGGAVLNKGTLTVKVGSVFSNNSATNAGGAIYNNGTLNIGNNVTFTQNSSFNKDGHNYSEMGGAIYSQGTADARREITIGNNVSFVGNEALAGASIYLYGNNKLIIGDNVSFENNVAKNGGDTTTAAKGAGIMLVGGENGVAEAEIGDNAKFINNTATYGTAINNNSKGNKVTIGQNAVFANNIGNTIYNMGALTIGAGSSFTGNTSVERYPSGSALWNKGTAVLDGAAFADNKSLEGGGAIFNEGDLTFKGKTVFSNNQSGESLNDISNAGSITVAENSHLILDGGISQYKDKIGTITFAEGSELTVKADTTTISGQTVTANNADLNLVFSNGYEGGAYALIGEGSTLVDDFTIANADNGLYTISGEKGKYNVEKKSTDAIAASTGASGNQAGAVTALTSGNSESTAFNDTANSINTLLQSSNKADVQAGLDAVTALSPEVAPMVQKTQTETANQVFGAVSTRLTGGSISTGSQGMSSGDNIFERAAMWVQGMFNKSKLDDTSKAKGFDADSHGLAFGFEKQINDEVKAGIGYAYTNTDIDGFMRDTDVDTHTAIIYGEYKPSNWYVNGIATYGWSDYEEGKNVAGVGVKADYDVKTFGLQAMGGYDMQVNGLDVTPEAGLRYMHISQDSYKDSMDNRVSGDDIDILTGVIGAKISKNFELSNGMNIKPEARIAATYDLMNDDVNSAVTLANGSAYTVDGEALDRFGMEFGAGLTAEVNDNVELSLGYEGKFREDYQDHTGLINAKYKF